MSCYIKNTQFSRGPRVLEMVTCPTCSSYKYKSTWLGESFDDVLKRFIHESFQISHDLKNVKIETDCVEKGKKLRCRVVVSGFLDDYTISEEHLLEVRVKQNTCDICSKQYGGYYEAILQIRSEGKPRKPEFATIRQEVEHFVETQRAKGNRGLFITDAAVEHGGFDFYLSEKGAAFALAKKIQERYGGTIKQSSKNIGMKDGRQVYRMTYLIRLPLYRKGDVFAYKKHFYLIASVKGTVVHGVELRSWNERVFDSKSLQKVTIVGGDDLVREMIVVSQTKDFVQVMDPETYTTVDLKKPKPVSFASKTVKIVELEDTLFVLPEKF